MFEQRMQAQKTQGTQEVYISEEHDSKLDLFV